METYRDLKIEKWSRQKQLAFLFKKAEVYNKKFAINSIVNLNLYNEETVQLEVGSNFAVDAKRGTVIFFEKYQKDEAVPTFLLLEDVKIEDEILKTWVFDEKKEATIEKSNVK